MPSGRFIRNVSTDRRSGLAPFKKPMTTRRSRHRNDRSRSRNHRSRCRKHRSRSSEIRTRCGPIAASSAAPVARQITMTKRASGKPTPGACVLGWGYTAWFSWVSGIDSPVPSTSLTARPRQRLLAKQVACLARERADHLQRQPLAGPAIPTGANAARAQTLGRALRGPAVDRLLTLAIGLQHLAHEHRQRHRRRIQPLAVLGLQRFSRLEQLRARQHVEELHRLGRSGPPWFCRVDGQATCSSMLSTLTEKV